MNTNFKRKIFIGAAWPYVNGSPHLGHIAGILSGDILARYYRLQGNEVLFVSGSDCHGTPIIVEAEKKGISPAEIAEKYDKEFRKTLIDGLGFSYNLYSKTTSELHARLVQEIFLKLFKKGLIYKKSQNLPFCQKCNRFLPDRYIEGICPNCKFEEARGDQCDECGRLLDPKDLLNPRCKICGASPVWKKSEHFFLKLSYFKDQLEKWVRTQTNWRENSYQFTLNILEGGLKDRPITRDIEWGIKIPIPGYEKKCIYVWFEAVCGYLSASQEWAKDIIKKPDKWKDFWQDESYHYYVHGKDNIFFHTIIWPAILLGIGNLNLPNQIVSSEYLTLEGRQFSKSRNWAIWLPEFLKKYDPDSLRLYLTISGPETSDANFSWKEYVEKNNTELVGNYGNFIYRALSFAYKNFDRKIPKEGDIGQCRLPEDEEILELCENSFKKIGEFIEKAKLKKALKEISNLIHKANQYIDQKSPWHTIKTDQDSTAATIYICIQIINALRILMSPFLPFSSEKIKAMLNLESRKDQWKFSLLPSGHKIKRPKPLFVKLDSKTAEEELEKLKGK